MDDHRPRVSIRVRGFLLRMKLILPPGMDLTEYMKGGELMNPLKWAVWIRIAVVASILWVGAVVVDMCQSAYGRWDANFLSRYVIAFLPVFLFWGIVWIAHGISDRKIRVRVIKILIGIPVVIFAAGALVFIFIQIYDSFSPSPVSSVPQLSVVPQEIPPLAPGTGRFQWLMDKEKQDKKRGDKERHKPECRFPN